MRKAIVLVLGALTLTLVALSTFAAEATIEASGTIGLTWVAPTENEDGSELTDLAGYVIHWGRESGTYTNTLAVHDASRTTATLQLETDRAETPYYFVMTAVDEDGNVSQYSNEVLKLLVITVQDNTPPGAATLSTEIEFTLESCVVVSNPSATCTVTLE